MDRIGYVGMMFHKSFKFFLLRYVIPYLAVLLILAVFDDSRLVFGEVFSRRFRQASSIFLFLSRTQKQNSTTMSTRMFMITMELIAHSASYTYTDFIA